MRVVYIFFVIYTTYNKKKIDQNIGKSSNSWCIWIDMKIYLYREHRLLYSIPPPRAADFNSQVLGKHW